MEYVNDSKVTSTTVIWITTDNLKVTKGYSGHECVEFFSIFDWSCYFPLCRENIGSAFLPEEAVWLSVVRRTRPGSRTLSYSILNIRFNGNSFRNVTWNSLRLKYLINSKFTSSIGAIDFCITLLNISH